MNLLFQAFIHWNVDPELVNIFGVSVRWYGLLFASGFVFGHRILTSIFKNDNRTEKDVEKLTLYMIIGTVAGARLGHCLFYDFHYYFIENPLEIFNLRAGGLASHGAAFGILISLFLFSKKHNFSYLWLLDRIAIVVALAGAMIRLGNLMNSEIVGLTTTLPWGFQFMQNDCFNPNGCSWENIPPRHPAQLYESISSFVIFLALYFAYWKSNIKLTEGKIFSIFLVVLFTLRFLYEFLKENQSDFENALLLNMGQILSIPMVIVGLVLYMYISKKKA